MIVVVQMFLLVAISWVCGFLFVCFLFVCFGASL